MAVPQASSSRIADSMVAFTLRLYESKSYRKTHHLWCWSVSTIGCNGDSVAAILDVKIADLMAMRRVIDGHIEMISEHSKSLGPQPAEDDESEPV